MRAGIPCCAACGRPLAYVRDRVTVTMRGLPGSPTVGWHLGPCERKDRPIAAAITCELLLAILERGVERVVSRHRHPHTREYRWRPGLTSKGFDRAAAGAFAERSRRLKSLEAL